MDLADLKAKAEAAPIDRSWKRHGTIVFLGEGPGPLGGFDVHACPKANELAAYIAAASPPTVLALIRVAMAADTVANVYDDFSEPLKKGDPGAPEEPDEFNAARQELYDALAALDDL